MTNDDINELEPTCEHCDNTEDNCECESYGLEFSPKS